MLRFSLEPRITTLWEAEQHVYGIPSPGVIASRDWTSLTHERRISLRTLAISVWQWHLEHDCAIAPHPPILIPEYRQMLTHPDGILIVEEL